MSKNVVPVKGGFADKVKRLHDLDGEHVEVGWFNSQGMHPSGTKTYAEVARYHGTGEDGAVFRPMLHIALDLYKMDRNKKVGKALAKYMIKPTDTSYQEILDTVANEYKEKVQDVIGNPMYLEVTNNPTPLYDTGALHDHVASKNSINPTISVGVK